MAIKSSSTLKNDSISMSLNNFQTISTKRQQLQQFRRANVARNQKMAGKQQNNRNRS